MMIIIDVMGTYYYVYKSDERTENEADYDGKRLSCPNDVRAVRKAIADAFAYECGNATICSEWLSIVGPRIAEAWTEAEAKFAEKETSEEA